MATKGSLYNKETPSLMATKGSLYNKETPSLMGMKASHPLRTSGH